MNSLLSIGVDALAYGMVLFVISIGLSMTMGLMRVVNLAHGAFAMIGGYLASYAVRDLGMGYFLGMLLAIAGTVAIAAPMERLLYRRIYDAPELTQVLMTIGITFCIIGIANYLFGPTLKTIPLPALLQWAGRPRLPFDCRAQAVRDSAVAAVSPWPSGSSSKRRTSASSSAHRWTTRPWPPHWAFARSPSMPQASPSRSAWRRLAASSERNCCRSSHIMRCATW